MEDLTVVTPGTIADRITRARGLLMRAREDCVANANHTGDDRFYQLAEAVHFAEVAIQYLQDRSREIADSYERLE
jgi:hypothetical protein